MFPGPGAYNPHVLIEIYKQFIKIKKKKIRKKLKRFTSIGQNPKIG
jgi:hypothetical protein